MPYNEKTHIIEPAPEVRKWQEERKNNPPYSYELYGYCFATMEKLPADIEADLRHHAAVIQCISFYTDAEKAERFRDVFKQAVEMAGARRKEEEVREIGRLRIEPLEARPYNPPVKVMPTSNPSMDYLQKMDEEFRTCQISLPDYLACTGPHHPGGIIAQVRDMQPITSDDSIELKLPTKHKTVIQL